MDDRGIVDLFSVRWEVFVIRKFHTDSGTWAAFCPMTRGPVLRRPGRQDDQLPRSSVEVKNEWSYILRLPCHML